MTDQKCVWHQDDAGCDSQWETQCGHTFEFNDGDGPLGNGYKFCSYCGKQLIESRTSDADDDGVAASRARATSPPVDLMDALRKALPK